jgi:Rop protein
LAKTTPLGKARNMAGFFKSQSLVLLEVLDGLGLDEQAVLCERIHELAEEITKTLPSNDEAAS